MDEVFACVLSIIINVVLICSIIALAVNNCGPKFCPECGGRYDTNTVYCDQCGVELLERGK
jgi:hypothetical protein